MKAKHAIIESIFLLLFGVFVVTYSLRIENSSGDIALSPGLFPSIIGYVIILLASILLFRTIKNTYCDTSVALTKRIVIKQIVLIAICFLYITLMRYLKFIPATIIFLAGTTVLLGEKKWWKALALASLGSMSIYAAFQIGLKVYLP